jgi:aminodeoxyfutalosine deaminase
MQRTLLNSGIIYNGLGMPRHNSAVVIQEADGEARVIAIDELEVARANFSDATEKEVGFAVTIPVVNPHVHLDLSIMPYTPGGYEDFIRSVIKHGRAGQRNLEAAKQGLETLQKLGIKVIGDIVTEEEVMRWLLQQDMQGVAYWEIFEPSPEKAEEAFNKTVDLLREFRKLEQPGKMKVGLSPHTPHTVSAPLLQKLATLSKQHHIPMQIHVAENPNELTFHKNASGVLYEMMRPFMGGWQPSGLSPVQYLKSLGVLEAQPSLVHMVNVSEDDVREVQKAGCVVVHCPRSNEALGCGKFPWELYAKHGVTVALGTDSLGSSPSLSIEEETHFAQTLHGQAANPLALVWSATKGGYRALGMPVPRFVRGDSTQNVYVWKESSKREAVSPLPPSND